MNELLRLLPPIRRTRGNRLYAADGRRFLDLWLDGGRGILGDRDRHARMFASNAADKGLTRPYPGLYDARFRRAVLAAWPAWKDMRVYSSEARAVEAAARILGAPATFADTVTRAGSPAPAAGAVALLRPFAPEPAGCALAIPRLPSSAPFSPACLMARDTTTLAAETGEMVPQMLLYSGARALDSLATAGREGYGPELWARWDRRMASYFDRVGPWLLARVEEPSYPDFFSAALEGGALVSPAFDHACVIPPDFDDGELKKLAESLARAGFGERPDAAKA